MGKQELLSYLGGQQGSSLSLIRIFQDGLRPGLTNRVFSSWASYETQTFSIKHRSTVSPVTSSHCSYDLEQLMLEPGFLLLVLPKLQSPFVGGLNDTFPYLLLPFHLMPFLYLPL